jgi:hypothetical protein
MTEVKDFQNEPLCNDESTRHDREIPCRIERRGSIASRPGVWHDSGHRCRSSHTSPGLMMRCR